MVLVGPLSIVFAARLCNVLCKHRQPLATLSHNYLCNIDFFTYSSTSEVIEWRIAFSTREIIGNKLDYKPTLRSNA
jgi:hypothetical protein